MIMITIVITIMIIEYEYDYENSQYDDIWKKLRTDNGWLDYAEITSNGFQGMFIDICRDLSFFVCFSHSNEANIFYQQHSRKWIQFNLYGYGFVCICIREKARLI